MNKIIRFISIPTGILLILGMAYWFRQKKDPVFNGKHLSQYLEKLVANGYSFGPPGTTLGLLDEPFELQLIPNVNEKTVITELDQIQEEATQAIQAQGTNAFPLLISLLKAKESEFGRLHDKVSLKWNLPPLFHRKPWDRPFYRKVQALCALQVLTTNANSVVNDVIPLLTDPDTETVRSGIMAIQLIKPTQEQHILSLTNVAQLRKKAPSFQADNSVAWAIIALGSFESRAIKAGDFIKSAMSSSNHFVRASSAVAMARIRIPSQEAVPLIIKSLEEWFPPSENSNKSGDQIGNRGNLPENIYVVMHVWALEQYGSNSKNALPILNRIEDSITDTAYESFKWGLRKSMENILADKEENKSPDL